MTRHRPQKDTCLLSDLFSAEPQVEAKLILHLHGTDKPFTDSQDRKRHFLPALVRSLV